MLAPISPVVSGALSIAFKEKHDPLKIARWKETGWKEEESVSTPGLIKRLPWSHMEDRLKYDLLTDAHKLTMPVLLIVGDKDDSTPPEHIELFYETLQEPKELHIVPDAHHTFRSVEHLKSIEEIFTNWIKRYI
jgi:dipeptidyl aminopeptidase/acylaminoacyl peptidase